MQWRVNTGQKSETQARETSDPLVVMVHGLANPRLAMLRWQWALERKYGRKTFNFPYNSWRYDVPEAARLLSEQLAQMQVKEVDALTHSMGGIILRWAYNNFPMPRLRRAVLVGPPNRGSQLASKLEGWMGPFYPMIWGECAMQMRPGRLGLAAMAGRLDGAEVGIIAGGSGTPQGIRNVFGLDGDNDRIVTVEETILPGMKDFMLLRLDHSSLLLSAQTAHMANLFLEHGVFRPKVKEASVPVEVAAPAAAEA